MILTLFPSYGLLYMPVKLLWTLRKICYILTSEKSGLATG